MENEREHLALRTHTAPSAADKNIADLSVAAVVAALATASDIVALLGCLHLRRLVLFPVAAVALCTEELVTAADWAESVVPWADSLASSELDSVGWTAIERDWFVVAAGSEHQADHLVSDKLFDFVDELHIRHLKASKKFVNSSIDSMKIIRENVEICSCKNAIKMIRK